MRQIAIPFELDENWVGGSYYIRNLISAMKLLPEVEQPFILMISQLPKSVHFIQEIGYPHVGWVTNKEFEELAAEGLIDVLFPHSIAGQEARTISWIPDFQELHLGYFFSDEEIARRRDHHRRRFATAGLIVSSEDVRKDVDTFYPGECQDIAVVRFASFDTHDPSRIKAVCQQYGLPERYAFCANQVWLHKNHILVIRAIARLKEMSIDVDMVFTGNEADYRVANYADFLKRQAAKWGVADRVHFLGFIPRDDQLCLMKGARYIVQPSLFEGWSTVIEDAKAMGKFIIASDLGVHKEQLTEACRFFFSHDPEDLAEVIGQVEEHDKQLPLPERRSDYTEARRLFACDFMEAVRTFLPIHTDSKSEGVLDKIRTLSTNNLAKLEGSEPTLVDNKTEVVQQSSEMLTDVLSEFRISIDQRSDIFNVLHIFSDRPVQMRRHYDKFMIKLIQIRSAFQVELRSDSITPAIITAENSYGHDAHGYFLRIPLHRPENGVPMTSRVRGLTGVELEDVNIALKSGIACLLQQVAMNQASIPAGLTPITSGVRLYSK